MEPYKPLSILYHMDEKEYARRYAARIDSESTIHLPFTVHEQPAFVFLSLPLFQLSEKVLQANATLSRLSRNLPCTELVFMDAVFREIENSNEIEGVHSSRQQLEQALNTETAGRFSGIVHQYQRLLSSQPDPFPTSLEEIRKLYNVLLAADINKKDLPDGQLFRSHPVYVVSSRGAVHTGVFPEEKICDNLQTLLEIMEDNDIPSLIRAGIFHFLFGYIHPFYDGNGRLNRYLSTLFVAKKLGLAASLQLSVTLRQRRKDYYKMFELCEHPLNKGELTPFVEFFLEALYESLSQEIEILQIKSAQYTTYEEKIENMEVNETARTFLLRLAQASLFTMNGLGKQELASYLHCSAATINKLVTQYRSLIHVTKQGRFNRYMLKEQI